MYDYTNINTVFDVPIYNSLSYKAVLIDYSKSTALSEEEITRMIRLYLQECYYIFLLHYNGEGVNDLIDSGDYGKDIIVLGFITCNEYFNI